MLCVLTTAGLSVGRRKRAASAAAAARLRKEPADAELKRLNEPAKEASSLLADAKKRWKTGEIKRAAEREAALREKDRAKARQAVIEVGVALNAEELRLREALLNDPSRAWAWGTLFAIFGVINLAGPLAIARVLERWRADHAEAEASAKDGQEEVGGGVVAGEALGAKGARDAAATGAAP